MPRVFARCALTKEPAPTKFLMDEATFRLIRLSGISFDCPVCMRRHEIDQHDAWVARPDDLG